MSATADKARFFLEQSVPELKEYERKKIFSHDELTSIARKRSEFEHRINARGSEPGDYAKYAEFEINVENLRRIRVKRLGIKSTAHNGQRRIYFVFDRGNRRFPGDIDLWMQSIEHARRQKAYKKAAQLITNALRLHPTKTDLWIYAAQFAVEENGDMTEARSYMQRGLRFCKNNRNIWLEYARLEMGYMAKIYARRQILGMENHAKRENIVQIRAQDNDILPLSTTTAEHLHLTLGNRDDVESMVLESLDETPLMNGAIPRAIFDAAMAQFHDDGALYQAFFDLVAEFCNVPGCFQILDHVMAAMKSKRTNVWQTHACFIKRPLVGLSFNQPEYPVALRDTLRRKQEVHLEPSQKSQLDMWYKDWLRQQQDPEMDPALKIVISVQIHGLDQNKIS